MAKYDIQVIGDHGAPVYEGADTLTKTRIKAMKLAKKDAVAMIYEGYREAEKIYFDELNHLPHSFVCLQYGDKGKKSATYVVSPKTGRLGKRLW